MDAARLIVGPRVRVAATDKPELAADVAALSPGVKAEVKAGLAASGFYSEAMGRAGEQSGDGPASGLTVYAAGAQQGPHKRVALLPQPEPEPLAKNASAQEKRAPRMKPPTGQTLYKLRKQTVAPGFGIIKEVLGFQRFLLRGRAKVTLEWLLVCGSDNLKRRFTLKILAGTG